MNNYLAKWDNVVQGSHSELGLRVHQLLKIHNIAAIQHS